MSATSASVEFPTLLMDAEKISARSQTNFYQLTRWMLALALLAALGGAFSLNVTVDREHYNISAAVAVLAFLASIALTLCLLSIHPERNWYDGRAAAESIKSVCWQYAVGGGPFRIDKQSTDADQLLINRLEQVVAQMHGINLISTPSGSQIPEKLRLMRNESLATRRSAYVIGRVEDQCTWYSNKAIYNATRYRIFYSSAIAFQFLGVVMGVIRAIDLVDIDLLGVAAAGAATVIAWVQARDHGNLAEAYSVTARDLAMVRTRADALPVSIDELIWADFVDSAEQAISREHTMWLARRGSAISTQ